MLRQPTLALICGFVLSGIAPARAQTHFFSADTPVVRRWALTCNPFGMGEDPRAFGAGVGYYLNNRMEIWEETSFLQGWEETFPNGDLKGFRQIVRFSMALPKWIYPDPHFLLAVELRYRTYSYRDTSDFDDPATGDKVVNVHFLSRHYIFGVAGQVGYRLSFTRDGRWSGELTVGLGVKDKRIVRQGAPRGYQWMGTGVWSTDLNIRDMVETPGGEPYVPGSLRIIYAFGRKVK